HALGYNTTTDVDELAENSRRIEQQEQRYRDDSNGNGNGGDDDDRRNNNRTWIPGNNGENDGHDCDIELMERKSSNGGGDDALNDLGGAENTENAMQNGNVNSHDSHDGRDDDDDEEDPDDYDELSPMKGRKPQRSTGIEQQQDEEEPSNLNMCSAYTHVFADTLRSLAVILASLLAEFTSTVTSEVADSTAAVVVSALIMLSLLPLFGGMVQTFAALKRVNRQIDEEKLRQQREGGGRSETVLFEDDNDGEEEEEPELNSNKKAVIEFV
ncbi:MAG: hypothetical protein SGARI_006826, partial [Bacillariaceae sp.]